MKEVYRDEFCRLVAFDNPEVGSRKKEYRLVALESDYLPPHWPTTAAMRKTMKELDKVKYV